MIGGEVAMRVSPRIMADLAAPMDTVIVSGTNGKSTTTRMVRAALETRGPVASNTNGDNMASGVITALMNAPRAPFAALEVDEMHLPAVAGEVNPEVLVLLNLSRDQLDRVGEISSVELRLRQAVEDHPNAIIIANCDDPLIVSAACSSSKVVWVAAGGGWGADSILAVDECCGRTAPGVSSLPSLVAPCRSCASAPAPTGGSTTLIFPLPPRRLASMVLAE